MLEWKSIFLENVIPRPATQSCGGPSESCWARTIMDALSPDSGLRPEADPEQTLDRRAHRNLLLLALCQAVGQSCNTM